MPTTLPPFVTYALNAVGGFKYPILFVGTIIEGPMLMIACGFLLRYGYFDFLPLFITLASGDLLGDIIWYYVGHFYAHSFISKFGRFFHITPERFEKAKNLFAKYHVNLLLISKVTLGFGMAIVTLIAAGASRIPFRTYFFLNFIGELILIGIMLSIGYFFGSLYEKIEEGFRISFIVSMAVIAVALVYGFARFMKHKIAHE